MTISTLLPQYSFSQVCSLIIDVEHVYDEEALSSGCAPVSYCFNLYVDEGESIDNLELSIISTPGAEIHIPFLNPIDK